MDEEVAEEEENEEDSDDDFKTQGLGHPKPPKKKARLMSGKALPLKPLPAKAAKGNKKETSRNSYVTAMKIKKEKFARKTGTAKTGKKSIQPSSKVDTQAANDMASGWSQVAPSQARVETPTRSGSLTRSTSQKSKYFNSPTASKNRPFGN